jgi:hypothetical protein
MNQSPTKDQIEAFKIALYRILIDKKLLTFNESNLIFALENESVIKEFIKNLKERK